MSTPAQGPYTVGKPEMMRDDWRCEIFTPTDFSVGFAFGNTEAECLANAHLMAASWDAIAACREFARWEDAEKTPAKHSNDPDAFYRRVDMCRNAFDMCRAALRRTEGGEK